MRQGSPAYRPGSSAAIKNRLPDIHSVRSMMVWRRGCAMRIRLITMALAVSSAVISTGASAMSLSFSWAGVPHCSHHSPAFMLSGVPAGTARLAFRPIDLDFPPFPHGGGTIPFQGGQVPAGELRLHRPRPPPGQHRYNWIVQALDAGGRTLATASAMRPFFDLCVLPFAARRPAAGWVVPPFFLGLRTAEEHMAKFESILETVGNTPVVRINRLAPAAREPVRQDRGLQSARLGEGPPRARRDRGGGEIRRAQARPDRDRGDQRQHRHRPCDGLRREGLSAGRHDGGDLQRGAAQADALPRRQGGADAGRRSRPRHGQQGGRARRRRTAGS